jgi:hypothetical protein
MRNVAIQLRRVADEKPRLFGHGFSLHIRCEMTELPRPVWGRGMGIWLRRQIR